MLCFQELMTLSKILCKWKQSSVAGTSKKTNQPEQTVQSVQADYYFISERKCLGKQFLYDAGDNAAVGLASHLL